MCVEESDAGAMSSHEARQRGGAQTNFCDGKSLVEGDSSRGDTSVASGHPGEGRGRKTCRFSVEEGRPHQRPLVNRGFTRAPGGHDIP
jgi:hypothetical protein